MGGLGKDGKGAETPRARSSSSSSSHSSGSKRRPGCSSSSSSNNISGSSSNNISGSSSSNNKNRSSRSKAVAGAESRRRGHQRTAMTLGRRVQPSCLGRYRSQPVRHGGADASDELVPKSGAARATAAGPTAAGDGELGSTPRVSSASIREHRPPSPPPPSVYSGRYT